MTDKQTQTEIDTLTQTQTQTLTKTHTCHSLTELHLRRFDMARMRQDAVVVIGGRRGTGKTVCAVDILFHLRGDVSTGTIVSFGESRTKRYTETVIESSFHAEYTPDIACNFLKQRLSTRYAECQGTFLLLDDCLHDDKWQSDKAIVNIMHNRRALQTSLIVTMQHVQGIRPGLRANVDYVFLFHDTDIRSRKRTYDEYGGIFQTFAVFSHVLDACCKDHECMVIDFTRGTDTISDSVYWYRADVHQPFCMGREGAGRGDV